MAFDQYRHFVAIVAGDKPDELMKKYDKNTTVKPYAVYKKAEAEKIKDYYEKYYEAEAKAFSDTNQEDEAEKSREFLNFLRKKSAEDFFDVITASYMDDPDEVSPGEIVKYIDEDTGDAMTNSNPDGKFSSYNIGKFFSVPFMKIDGEETFQALKSDIDWSVMHLNNQEVYKRAWEMVMEGSEPANDDERNIYENMKNRTGYFEKFGTKDNYVMSSTAFWGFAFLSEVSGWVELEDNADQFFWMSNFYDMFIVPLPDDTLLTIYECTRE